MSEKSFNEQMQILNDIKRDLEEEIEEIRDKEIFERAKAGSNSYQKYIFQIMPIKYLKSTFHTKADELRKYATASREPYCMKKIMERLDENEANSDIVYYVMYCNAAKKTEEGYILYLEDPYGKYETSPIYPKIEDETNILGYEENIPDRMYQIRAVFNKNNPYSTKLEVQRAVSLPYSIHDVYSGGRRRIPTVDYDELSYMENIRGIDDCWNTCRRFVEEKVKRGAITSSTPNEDKDYGYLYVREEFKEYTLVYKDGFINAAVREVPALNEYEEFLLKTDEVHYADGIDVITHPDFDVRNIVENV